MMRIIRIINKSFKDAFKSVVRNFSLSMSSISCTAITLILVSLAILITYNVNSTTRNIEKSVTINVFLNYEISENDVNKFIADVNNMKNINKDATKYVNSDEAKNELIAGDENLKSVFDVLGFSPLQPKVVLKVNDVHEIKNTVEAIKGMDSVQSVEYSDTAVERATQAFDFLRKAGYVAVAALVVVTFFLISNTIKITIFSRRNEINIMRLVGTSNTVIKLPFVIEGFLLGLIGAILPVLLTIYGYQIMYDYVGGKLLLSGLSLVPASDIVYLTSLVLLLIGSFIGMIASLKSVKRYLKI